MKSIRIMAAAVALTLGSGAALAQSHAGPPPPAEQHAPMHSMGTTHHRTMHHSGRRTAWSNHVRRCRAAHPKSYDARTNTYKIAGAIKRRCKA